MSVQHILFKFSGKVYEIISRNFFNSCHCTFHWRKNPCNNNSLILIFSLVDVSFVQLNFPKTAHATHKISRRQLHFVATTRIVHCKTYRSKQPYRSMVIFPRNSFVKYDRRMNHETFQTHSNRRFPVQRIYNHTFGHCKHLK